MSSSNINLPEKYVIKKEIGSGGMARVFLAEDKELGKYVAVKVLNLDSTSPTSNQQRFKEEMRLVQYIKSPYIVRFYEGKYDKNIKYLAMEYVQGKMLKEIIEIQGRLQPERAVDYAIQIAKGFAEIHAQNIVHRDLKTSNVMITNTGQVKDGLEKAKDNVKNNSWIGKKRAAKNEESINTITFREDSEGNITGCALGNESIEEGKHEHHFELKIGDGPKNKKEKVVGHKHYEYEYGLGKRKVRDSYDRTYIKYEETVQIQYINVDIDYSLSLNDPSTFKFNGDYIKIYVIYQY